MEILYKISIFNIFLIILIIFNITSCKFNTTNKNKIVSKNYKSGKEEKKKIIKKLELEIKEKKKKNQAQKENKIKKEYLKNKEFESIINKIKKALNDTSKNSIVDNIILRLDLERNYPGIDKLSAMKSLIKENLRSIYCKLYDINITYIYKNIIPIYNDYFEKNIKTRLEPLIKVSSEINKNLNSIKAIDKDLVKHDSKDETKKDLSYFRANFVHTKSKFFIKLLEKEFCVKLKC